jgi:hypothetical protein
MERYWMAFALRPEKEHNRRLGIAVADQPIGPWKFLRQLIEPTRHWEGNDIDLGPGVFSLNEKEHLLFYSNVSNKAFLDLVPWPRYWHRQVGILTLQISQEEKIKAERCYRNPLGHLNGQRGSWNESVFCSGYFQLQDKHYLLPATSTYSIGFPYGQYNGLVEDSSPFFENPTAKKILIDGPNEKNNIIPDIKSEIALDLPSPLLRTSSNELWLYYSVMDRADGVWKTALSIFSL